MVETVVKVVGILRVWFQAERLKVFFLGGGYVFSRVRSRRVEPWLPMRCWRTG